MSYYLQEDGTSKFVLEDGSGDYLLEGSGGSISITDTGVTVTDNINIINRVVSLTDTGLSLTESVASSRLHTATSTGLTVTDSLASLRSRLSADVGLTVTDSLAKINPRSLTDAGISLSEALTRLVSPYIEDDGLLFSDSLGNIFITDEGFDGLNWDFDFIDAVLLASATDTGVTITDSLVVAPRRRHLLVSTGITVSDGIHKSVAKLLTDTGCSITSTLGRSHSVSATDTGLTVTDTTKKVARKVLTDRGMTFSMALWTSKNSHGASVIFSDIGLTIISTITRTMSYFRSIPIYAPDTGLTISDGIIVSTTPPSHHTNPQADFSFVVLGLTVNFTDTSTPGSSGPITHWSWSFGDGSTSTAQDPSHTYSGFGTHNVTLTVTGTVPDGHSSITHPVTISSPSLSGIHLDLVAI